MAKNTVLGMKLAKSLAEHGYRVFDFKAAETLGKDLKIRNKYISECLYHLKQAKWVTQIRRGLFALSSTFLSGGIVNEYEIAMAIVEPAAISYWSALRYHQLTDQIPRDIFVLTTANSKVITIKGVNYNITKTMPDHYFGIQKVWFGDAQIYITDLERTLLDALTKPQFCGGFSEVIEAYILSMDKFNSTTLIEYANKFGDSAIRRLGWMLDHIGMPDSSFAQIRKCFIGHVKLNSAGERSGKYNSKWGVIENI
jgi:predicted transcriptional regulator of viral defense system